MDHSSSTMCPTPPTRIHSLNLPLSLSFFSLSSLPTPSWPYLVQPPLVIGDEHTQANLNGQPLKPPPPKPRPRTTPRKCHAPTQSPPTLVAFQPQFLNHMASFLGTLYTIGLYSTSALW